MSNVLVNCIQKSKILSKCIKTAWRIYALGVSYDGSQSISLKIVLKKCIFLLSKNWSKNFVMSCLNLYSTRVGISILHTWIVMKQRCIVLRLLSLLCLGNWNDGGFFYSKILLGSSDGQRARFLGTGRMGIAHWWHGQNGQLPIKEISGTGMPYQAMGI